MKFKSKRTIDGGMIYYKDKPVGKKLLIIVGRDDFKKDDLIMEDLFNVLKENEYSIMWYEHIGTSTSRLLTPLAWNNFNFNEYPFLSKCIRSLYKYRIPRRICKSLIILWYPRRWGFMRKGFFHKTEQITERVKYIRIFVKSLGEDKQIVLLGRSSGGRVATLVEDEKTVSKIICLGYPFKHPEKDIEIDRVKHLEYMQKPVLIVQGVRDEYGGADVLQTYPLSPTVSVSLIDTNHNFDMSKQDLKSMALNIKNFIDSPTLY